MNKGGGGPRSPEAPDISSKLTLALSPTVSYDVLRREKENTALSLRRDS